MVNCKPNILFCLADDAGMHFGAYGCNWVETPAFDRVAKDGILFHQAYTCNSKCAPSRASMLTGRNSWQLKDAANHQCFFPGEFKTVFEELTDQGYHVGHTAKGWAPGDPGSINGEKRKLTGRGYNAKKCDTPTDWMNSCDYASNFKAFLDDNDQKRPFCFWYGCTEPHRGYEYRSGIEKNGHRTEDVDEVYDIWPDNEVVRTDLLDYGMEIEHYDRHMGRMLEILEERGELDNTLVVATSDNGMPFPRAKGQEYFYSNRLPLAIMWADGIEKPGRDVHDMVSFIDFAPTFLEIAGIEHEETGMAPLTGRSLTDILHSSADGRVNPERHFVLIGKERHDLGRPGDVGYPIRGIFKGDFLYLNNIEPLRWPAGNPCTGYMNCDGSPTKTEILKLRGQPRGHKYWEWSFGKRPAEELYNIKNDPACINNLVNDTALAGKKKELKEQMWAELKKQGDPRAIGGEPLDEKPTAAKGTEDFYNRYLNNEIGTAGWICESDIQADDF